MYSGMFDLEKHYAHLVHFKNNQIKRISKVNTGEFDKNILCAECDNVKLGALEKYASNVLWGKGKVSEKDVIRVLHAKGGINSIVVSNINYKKFKLFLLSILWRAHITNRDFFKNVNLDPDVAERLRTMLYNSDPGEEDEFKTSIGIFRVEVLKVNSIRPPIYIKDNGFEYCVFFINYGLYFFNLSQAKTLSLFKGHIKKTNTMEVPIFEAELAKKLYKSYTKEDV